MVVLGFTGVFTAGLVLWAFAAWGRTILLRLVGISPLFIAFEILVLHVSADTEFRIRRHVLRNNLDTLRVAVNEFTEDHGRPPASLDGLISAGYMHSIPVNPFSGQSDWRVIIKNEPTGIPARFEVFASSGEEPQPPVDSTTKAAVIFAALAATCLLGARICKRLQSRMATSILVLGLNLVGSISLLSAILVALVIWKGLSRS